MALLLWLGVGLAAEVRISEVTPRDRRMLADEDGDFSGWIELRNEGAAPMNLQGYGLSIRPSDPFRWMFGDYTLGPGQRTVVFASGKDRPGTQAAAVAEPFDPKSVGHLIWWLDAADPEGFEADVGPVARWRDKSGVVRPTFTPQDPTSVEGLVGWLDASVSESISQRDSEVLSWRDRRDTSWEATADDPMENPHLSPDAAAGKPAIRFDGVDDVVRFSALHVRTIISVVREDPLASLQRRTLLGGEGGSPLLRGPRATLYGDELRNLGGKAFAWVNGQRVVPSQFPLPARWAVVTTELRTPASLDRLGADRQGPGTFWQGEVAELLLFDRQLSAGARRGIEAFLADKWGIVLPAARPDAGDATQSIPWRRPVRQPSPLLGKPVVHFDGDDDFLQTTRMMGIRTIFWVLHQAEVPGVDDGPLLGDTALLSLRRGDDGALLSPRGSSVYARRGMVRINGEKVNPLTARLPGGWAVLEWRTTGPVQADALGTTLLNPELNWGGQFAEVLVYDQSLNDDQMARVRAWLASKWGVPVRPPHTDFTLSDESTLLTLTAPGGRLVDWTVVPALPPGRSWGRPETEEDEPDDDAEEWAAFAQPTPGAPNGPGDAPPLAPPEVTPTSGAFVGPVQVTLDATSPEATIYYTLDGSIPGPPSESFREVCWLDDALPEGALGASDTQASWEWVRAVGRTTLAHRSPADDGLRFHYCEGADPPLIVRAGDRLFADVWINPEAPPQAVMLAWYDRSWEHRAYWGEDVIPRGEPGTSGHVRGGELPAPGRWERLEVSAVAVGLSEGAAITGLMFLTQGGEVWWDRSGRLTRHAGGSRRYEGPITLTSTAVIRAMATSPGALPSEEVVRSYLVDFPTDLPVVSLAVDPPDLFSAERGLLVRGTNASPAVPYHGANFWRDWERKGWLAAMEPDGTVLELGGVGVKVHGAWTRSAPQKSLSLRARSCYGPSRIEWRAFPELPLQRFDSLLLRNSGNDWYHARIRDGFLQSLMAGTAVDVSAFRPAHLFLNGRYWGLLNLRERVDGAYLADHHPDVPDEEAVDLIENDARALEGDVTEFLKFADFIDTHSLEDPADYAVVTNWIDLDNYLDWICAELFMDNRDWPGHNLRCWRPRRPGGRWRWILNDLDISFSIAAFSGSDPNADNPTLASVARPRILGTYGGRSTRLFRRLLNNPAGRRAFLQRFSELLATRFATSTVVGRLDALAARLTPEMPRQIARWADSQEPRWPPLTSLAGWRGEVDDLRRFARLRPDRMRQQLVDFFQLPGIVPVTLHVVSGWRGRVWLGREPLDLSEGTFEFLWPAGVPLRLTARAGVGSHFPGWDGAPESGAVLEFEPTGPVVLTARFGLDEAFDPASLSPVPFRLREGDYRLDGFDDETPAGGQPPSAELRQLGVKDPPLDAETVGRWQLPYDLESKSRIVGLDAGGIGFINTGSARIEEGGGYVGELRLALDTTGMSAVTVRWVGGTVAANSRDYAIRLQWRPGDAGPWRDVRDATGRVVEYVRHADSVHQAVLGPVTLPPEAAHQFLVQLRWKYYARGGGVTGPRAFLRLDDILVSGVREPLGGQVLSVRREGDAFEALFDVPPHTEWQWEESEDLRHWRVAGTLQADAVGRLQLRLPISPDAAVRAYRISASVP